MPMFDMIETYAVKSIKLKPSTFLRFAVRTTYVGKCNYIFHKACIIMHQFVIFTLTLIFFLLYIYIYIAMTLFVGMTIPFFGGLMGFFGGFALAPTSYYVS